MDAIKATLYGQSLMLVEKLGIIRMRFWKEICKGKLHHQRQEQW